MYFLCGNANKIYLDALWRHHSALLPPVAECPCECKIPAEYTCPETNREFSVTVRPKVVVCFFVCIVVFDTDKKCDIFSD